MNKVNINFKDINNTPGGALAKLWRNMLSGNNLYPSIGHLVNRYTSKNSVADTKNSVRKTKASLIGNITAGEMTWKTFIKLLFEFIAVRKVDITIKLTFANNTEKLHSVTIVNDDMKKDNKTEKGANNAASK